MSISIFGAMVLCTRSRKRDCGKKKRLRNGLWFVRNIPLSLVPLRSRECILLLRLLLCHQRKSLPLSSKPSQITLASPTKNSTPEQQTITLGSFSAAVHPQNLQGNFTVFGSVVPEPTSSSPRFSMHVGHSIASDDSVQSGQPSVIIASSVDLGCSIQSVQPAHVVRGSVQLPPRAWFIKPALKKIAPFVNLNIGLIFSAGSNEHSMDPSNRELTIYSVQCSRCLRKGHSNRECHFLIQLQLWASS